MVDIVKIDGKARGVIVRNLLTGEFTRHFGHAVVLATGGYGNVYYLSTNAMGSNVTAAWKAYKQGAAFSNPCFTQIHPTCIPVSGDYQSKLTLMSESLRNDGRIWVPKAKGDNRPPGQIPENERDYYLERRYPAFGNLVPRDVASRAAKERCDEGFGVGGTGLAVYLDFEDAINRLGKDTVSARYGNLFAMYDKITGDNPYSTPMRIFPVILSYIAKRLPYLAETVSLPNLLIASSKSKYTAKPVPPTPNPSSHLSFAALEATSLGTRLPKAGYLLSK
jgi:succinate dehydrogenase / fumarate reductase flavoprotein subunit